MKRERSHASLSLFIISSHAQENKSKSSAIIRGGVNFANVSVSDDGDVDEEIVKNLFKESSRREGHHHRNSPRCAETNRNYENPQTRLDCLLYTRCSKRRY